MCFGVEYGKSNSTVVDKVGVPKVGMIFESYEQLLCYYEIYAKQEGFAVFQRTSTEGEGDKIYKTLSCCREGQRASKSKNEFRLKPSAGINCKARINIIIGADGSCIINSLELSHNHTLSREKSRFYHCNRALNPYIKKNLS
ncbi:hypothetical protein DCAR_0311774 [Daucus carota subsp. sativus]|uniref:FAR1 domain-containing protein n=1 Tax=Daucus carota subsp. sativus TaxID=79200 RepID=A0AAF1AU98_DAUCS|nr:hypothetical protein DCAR_0311774 [Daucus carota subsp. sativus]